MKLSEPFRLLINKVLLITLSYVLINLFLYFFVNSIIHSSYSLGPSDQFNAKSFLYINLLVGCIAGLFGGTSLVIGNSQYFRRRSYRFSIIFTLVSYVSIFLMVNVAAILFILSSQMEYGAITFDLFKAEWIKAFNGTFLANFILWGMISSFSLFILQVNDKFGPGILFKFLIGNYHQPKKEHRIFMFMDMKSSTTIAEKIGNEKYFRLLNDVFADLTNTILSHRGEIYQYVGDEIVICWTIKKGVKNGNFLHCFFMMQEKLIELSSFYMEKYSVIPEFKAGIHHGEVMAGEVGVIKKDIIYSGDVLNTTARIQEQCNHYKVNLLVSRETFELIQDSTKYELYPLGEIELRGKKSKIDICTISKAF